MTGRVEGVGTFTVGASTVRIVTDCAGDISALVHAEEQVVRKLADRDLWPHQTVTLFVLDNLAPLVGQLKEMGRLMDEALAGLPQRPMVVLYDPRHATECFVFVNRQIMMAEEFWGDSLAAEGLLAHEHAHPLSECPATHAARGLTVEAAGPAALAPLAARLGETLSTGAVTELLANAFCLAHGFGDALKHVNRISLRRAARNLAQRAELETRAAAAVAAGTLPADQAPVLLRLADAQIGLPFALETVPFHEAGLTAHAAELEGLLADDLLARMAPEMVSLYDDLKAPFAALRPDWGAARLADWVADILSRLSAFLSQGGAPLTLSLVPARLAHAEGSHP
ncbi:hypothetical protein [Aquabacter spiritensis]|uniref:Uncharacterized protein n=1 Tax=Aquabacter spiritensis TaxID=933073 RepID=A0A4R3LP59_9HYPH|nr:hypothetical protein [Aquabacter spiritensis]TCT02263.1 hypothetical protein EDC64_114124 [Aquabacter spiritensis]